MSENLEKTYNPKAIEAKLYEKWCDKLSVFEGDYDIKVSNFLEKNEELKDGDDIADLILLNLKK